MQLPGERSFVLNHGMDVTEQHEAEEALHMATRQRELILEAVGDGIYGIDLDGKLTFINEAGANALGYTAVELIGPRYARAHSSQPCRRHAVFQIDEPDFAGDAPVRADPDEGRGFLAQGRHGDSGGIQRQSADGRRHASRAWWWRSGT